MSSNLHRKLDGRLVLGLLALVGYLAVANVAGNLYPFSTFPMYSETNRETSRLILRDEKQAVHDVTAYAEFDCPANFELAPERCFAQSISYLDRAFIEHLQRERGAGREDVELVRRIFRLLPDGELTVIDCSIVKCRARAR